MRMFNVSAINSVAGVISAGYLEETPCMKFYEFLRWALWNWGVWGVCLKWTQWQHRQKKEIKLEWMGEKYKWESS